MCRLTNRAVRSVLQKYLRSERVYNYLLDDKLTRRHRFILKDWQQMEGVDEKISNELEELGIMHGNCFFKQTASWRGLRHCLYIEMPA